jgi:hypothetical protein
MAQRGRPSKFNERLTNRIAALYGSGKTDQEVAQELGISLSTLKSWKNTKQDFVAAFKEGKDVADQLVENAIFRMATGYKVPEEKIFCAFGKVTRVKTTKHIPPDVKAAIFWLKHRRPDEWMDRNTDDLGKFQREVRVGFREFCINAGYPPPFDKQEEMKAFAIDGQKPRMLLGARGYGKTDYLTILGVAYSVYMDQENQTALIITKSKARNTAIMSEIANALEANGVFLNKKNTSCVRTESLQGKDYSVEAITIKTSMRGRHPKIVIMDDPVTEEDVSEAMRQLVKRKYNEVLKLCDNVCVIGQPAHVYDLYSELRPSLNLMEVAYGAIPELDHDLDAQRLAGVDESSIQASYFLKVSSEEGHPFDQIKELDQYPSGPSVAFIDPSFEGHDYTALTIMRGYMGGVAVVGFAYKRPWHLSLESMIPHLTKYNVQRLCFETNSLGDQAVGIVREALKDTGIGVVGRKTTGNKHARIMAAGTFAHLIHLSKESDPVYSKQVKQYEFKAKHDDCPDSLASCLEWIGLIKGRL